jgi:hypothetical protein
VRLVATRADRSLNQHGEQADAIVTEVDRRTVGRARTADGSVRVRFEPAAPSRSGAPPDGSSGADAGEIPAKVVTEVDAVVDVGAAVAERTVGETVRIVYDPSDPSRVALVGIDRPRRGLPAVVALGLGSVLGVMAALARRRAWRIGRVVRREPWWPLGSRLVQVPQSVGVRAGSRTLVVLDAPLGSLVVEPVGLGRLDPTFAPEAWAAGLDGPVTVLAAPAGGHVLEVRRVSGVGRGPEP